MPKYISGLKQDSFEPLPEGKYPFTISSSRLTESKKKNPMIEITLDAGGNGHAVKVRDYLVFDGGSFTSAKIDQLRVCIGEMILPGEEVNIEAGDLLHKDGTVHLTIEEWNGKKRNAVGSYLEPEDDLPGLEVKPTKPAKKSAEIPY